MAQFTDEEVKQFIAANMANPLAIANAAKQYGYTAQQLSQITGYSLPDIYNYFKNANIQFWDQEVGPQPTVAQPVTQQAYQLGTTPPPSGIATLTTAQQPLYVQGPGQANVTGGAGPEPVTTPPPLGTGFDPRVADYSYTLTQEQDPRVKDALGDDYQINQLLGETGSAWTGTQRQYQALDAYGNPTGQFQVVADLGNRQVAQDLAGYIAAAGSMGTWGNTGKLIGQGYQAASAAAAGNIPAAIAAGAPVASALVPGLNEYAGIGNTIASGARLYSAIENKDVLGALAQGMALAGVDKLGDTGIKRGDIGLASRVFSSIQTGNIGGAVTALSDLAARADLPGADQGRLAGRSLELIQALESGNPANVVRAMTRFGNAAKEMHDNMQADAEVAAENEAYNKVYNQLASTYNNDLWGNEPGFTYENTLQTPRGTDEEYAGLDFGVNYGARGTDEEYAGLGPSISQEELLAILGSTAKPEGDVTITGQRDIIDELGGFVEPGMWNTGQVVDVTAPREPTFPEQEVVVTAPREPTFPEQEVVVTAPREPEEDTTDDLPPVSRPVDPTFPEQEVTVVTHPPDPEPELPQPPPLEPPVVQPPIPEVVVNPPTQPPVQPPPKKPPEEPKLPNLSWQDAQRAAIALGMPQLANVFYFGAIKPGEAQASASVTDWQGQQAKLKEALGKDEEEQDRAAETRDKLSTITAQLEKIFPGEDYATDMNDLINILRG